MATFDLRPITLPHNLVAAAGTRTSSCVRPRAAQLGACLAIALVASACSSDGAATSSASSGAGETSDETTGASSTGSAATGTTASSGEPTGGSTTGSSGTTPSETTSTGTESDSDDPTGTTTGGVPGCTADCKPKSLVIALDGTRPDALRYTPTPAIDSLIDGSWAGGYKGAYSPYAATVRDGDTYSGPNHGAIMTGATVTQLGVTDNRPDVMQGGNYEQFPHYLARLEASNPALNTSYMYTWPSDSFIPSNANYIRGSIEDNSTRRIEEILAGGYEDLAGDFGTAWTADMDPDALFVFYDFTDGAGHKYNFSLEAPSYNEALTQCDALIGRMLEAIRQRPTFQQENWQIVVTADHGGYLFSHSGRTAAMATIPFIVSSLDVEQGLLPEGVSNLDVAPTVLEHFGLAIPPELTGSPRGRIAAAPAPADVRDGLVAFYPFDMDLGDEIGTADAVQGANATAPATVDASGGKRGGFLRLGEGGSSYVTLGGDGGLPFGDDDDFTVALWFRSRGAQAGDPVILGNKDWSNGANPGWVLLANEGAGNSLGANFASAAGDRVDIEEIDYDSTEWQFAAITFRHDGKAMAYLGRDGDRLQWIGLEVDLVGPLASGLPLNVGQDGTGSYPFNFEGDIDELALWGRALGHDEILALYAGGAGIDPLGN
jgi:hypothetical protein